MLITDIALLLIMLIGLLRLGFYDSGAYGLGKLMWKQVGCPHPRLLLVVVFAVH